MRTLLKQLVPAGVRRSIKRRLGDWRLQKSIEPLRRNGRFTADELHEFWKAWGNEGFAADKRYLMEAIRLIEQHQGDVLECGTGGTTVIAGVLAQRHGFAVYCLEQDVTWSLAARRAVARNRLARVHILDTPLKALGEYMWYDTSNVTLPRHFGLIICDGPFIAADRGEPIYSNWRYGVLPYLRASGSTFDALLLDDVNDERAPAVLNRWQAEFGIRHDVIRASEGDCSVITGGSWRGVPD